METRNSANNINIQHFQVSFSEGWSWHTLDECLCFFLGTAAEKVEILSISHCQWSGRDRAKVSAHSFPHSCPIPLYLCVTAYATGSKFIGIPCLITWLQSNRSPLRGVTAVLSCLLHKNGFQIAPINDVLRSHSWWISHCTNISCIDGNWHNHSSQTTTANLSVLLGSAIVKHKSRAFGAILFKFSVL